MSNPLEVDRNPIYFLCVDEGQYRQQSNLSFRVAYILFCVFEPGGHLKSQTISTKHPIERETYTFIKQLAASG